MPRQLPARAGWAPSTPESMMPMTTPVLVFDRFTSYGLNYARSAAVLLILICVAVFIVLRLVSHVRGGGRSDA